MSRRMVAPGKWVDEAPASPYTGAKNMVGGPITDTGHAKRSMTPEQAEAQRVAHNAANAASRRRRLSERGRAA